MEYNTILSIGSSCSCSEIIRHFKEFKGNSPFDWTINKPSSILKILSCLYSYSIDELVDKFFNDEFEIHCPHHFPSMNDEHLSNFNHLKYYSSYNNSRENMKRRFKRLYDMLFDSNTVLLLLYTQLDKDREDSIDDYIKIQHLIQLYRPKHTFRIVIIDITYSDDRQKILEHHNIDYNPIERLDNENYLIIPCINLLEQQYSLNRI